MKKRDDFDQKKIHIRDLLSPLKFSICQKLFHESCSNYSQLSKRNHDFRNKSKGSLRKLKKSSVTLATFFSLHLSIIGFLKEVYLTIH